MKKLLLTALVPALFSGCIMYEERARHVVEPRNPLSVEEIIALSRGGSTDETIREELSKNGVQHAINADDIVAMKEAGVSETIIKRAIETPVLTARAGSSIEYRERYYVENDSAWFGAGFLLGAVLRAPRSSYCAPRYHYGPRW